MDVIPLPEIAAVVIVAFAVLGVRTLWGAYLVPPARRARSFRLSRQDRMDPQQMRARLMAACVMWVIISIPLILKVVPPNGIYGFRIPATQASRAIWYPANAFMGWALSIAAVVSASALLALPATAKRWLVWAAFLAPLFGAIAASFVYVKHLV
jgi:SdpI/YfhL protein family